MMSQYYFGMERNNFGNGNYETKISETKVFKKPCTHENKLYKTEMCRSVKMGINCKYENKCLFAHNLNELNIINCKFGDNCRHVHFNEENEIIDNPESNKSCFYKHDSETREQFLVRRKFVTKRKTPEKPVIKPKKPDFNLKTLDPLFLPPQVLKTPYKDALKKQKTEKIATEIVETIKKDEDKKPEKIIFSNEKDMEIILEEIKKLPVGYAGKITFVLSK